MGILLRVGLLNPVADSFAAWLEYKKALQNS
jgi:hypothetical protein